MKYGEAISWEELANIYDKTTGGKARIKPMDSIFKWAESRKDLFYLEPHEGTLHKIIK